MSAKSDKGDEDSIMPLRRAWELALLLLASKVSTVTFESYIRVAQPLEYSDGVVTLGVNNAFARDWLEKKAANPIKSALEFHLDTTELTIKFVILTREQQRSIEQKGKSNRIAVGIQSELPLGETENLNHASQKAELVSVLGGNTAVAEVRTDTRKSLSRSQPASSLPIPSLPVNLRYQFESFVVGRSNRLAHAGAVSVSERPGETYNPLFLYSGPGLGKTHLLQGIAHKLRASRPKERIAYVSGEFFAQHYIRALREHSTEEFRKQYRDVDVWLVDDVQFIAGKEHTKEEFFHTFNALYQGGKQIVITSDRSPRELNTMDERLRSRFQSGLIADIAPPELETRIAILQKYCERECIRVSENVLNYIASAIQSNIRALEGALTKLIAYSSIEQTPMSEEMAQSVLGEYFIEKPIRKRRLTIDEIIDSVAVKFGSSTEAIKGPSRNKEISLARHIAMFICRDLLPGDNIRMVGAAFGGRDHSTIVHACQKMEGLLRADTELRDLVKKISLEI